MVKADGAELAQRRVQPSDLVEPGQKRFEGAALGQGTGEVAGAQFVLLGVQVLLAAGAHRGVVEKFVAGVHAPRRAHRRGEHRADGEHARAAVLQALMQDIGCVDEQIWPRVVGMLGDLAAELFQLPFRGAPGEVRI